MPCDCTSVGLDEIFTERNARRDARRYRRRGLDPRARRLLSAVERAWPVKDASTLEIGAGVGGVSIELLLRGAGRATTIDAVQPAVAMSRRLAAERGVADRFAAVHADFTAISARPAPADIVVLDRVVCCHPDGIALLHGAAQLAQRVVAVSYPRTSWWTTATFRALNLGQALLRRRFRLFLHPPAELQQALRRAGFSVAVAGHYWPWELVVASRERGG